MIKILEIENGWAVLFPKPLKDAFKKVFPSAKWNPDQHRWEVGPRSEKRLRQWAEVALPAAQEIEESEESEMTASELAQIQTELSAFRARIAAARQSIGALNELAQALQSARAQVADVATEAAAVVMEKKAAEQSALVLLSGVVDLGEIKRLKEEMARNMRPGQRTREAFERAQKSVIEQSRRLRAAGFRSTGISELANANFNRPDRDHPKFVTDEMLINISPIPQETVAPHGAEES